MSLGFYTFTSFKVNDISSLVLGISLMGAGIVFLCYTLAVITGLNPAYRYYEFKVALDIIVARAKIDALSEGKLSKHKARDFELEVSQLYRGSK